MLSSIRACGRRIAHILCISAAFLCTWAPAPAAQEKTDYFAGLRQRLITDGFPAEAISALYSRPEVFV
ncbi:MAG: hypothetical protein ACM3KE_21170, partial [Hyphomicrobiales bacterium]